MIFETISKYIREFGGVVAISGVFAAFISNIIASRVVKSYQAKLDRKLETHKDFLARKADRNRLLLKRQELMFEREYEASADFYKIFISITPSPWAPDLEWLDAQKEIAENFGNHEDSLKRFLFKHAASLSDEARNLIESACRSANRGKFEVGHDAEYGEYPDGVYPNKEIQDEVNEFYEYLKKAEKRLMVDLREGSF